MDESASGTASKPAGCGKTQMGLALIRGMGTRLWLTHTKDLLNQSKERAERYMDKPDGNHHRGQGGHRQGHHVRHGQTMSKMDLREYRHEWGVIICDECIGCAVPRRGGHV